MYRDRDLVVKCAPGIDFDELGRLGFSGEIEITSLGGSVREACLWSSGLAEAGVRRRATMLDGPEQITDAEPDDCPVAPAGRWIVDPDGAVVRAGLVRHYAARHGLWQLDPDIAYLSGDRLPDGVRGFEVLDEIGFSEKRLATGAVGTRRGCRRDSGARRRRRPGRAAARLRLRGSQQAVRGDRPHRLRHGKSGNGIHLPTVAVTSSCLDSHLLRSSLVPRCVPHSRSPSGSFAVACIVASAATVPL